MLLEILLQTIFLSIIWCIGLFNVALFWVTSGFLIFGYFIYLLHGYFNQNVGGEILPLSSSATQLPPMPLPGDDWMNKIIKNLWPFIAIRLENLIETQVQPTIRQSSSLLTNLTFTDISLGDIAPLVEIVDVHADSAIEEEITVDMRLLFNSNCNIEVKANRLKAGVCDLSVEGLLRVQFCSIADEGPLFGALTATFPNEPVVKYDLTRMANLLDLPGFDKVLKYAVSHTIKSLVVLPKKICMKINQKLDLLDVKAPLPKGLLYVNVIGAHNLSAAKRRSLLKKIVAKVHQPTDPYTVVKVAGVHKRTKTLSHTVHPMWNESFVFNIFDICCTKVEFVIHDDDHRYTKKDSLLGSTSCALRSIFERGVIDQVVVISSEETTKLHVRMLWFELSKNPADLPEARRLLTKNVLKHTCFLSISIYGADRLADEDAAITPCATIDFPDEEEVFKTKISKLQAPKWKENFQAGLKNPEDHWFKLEVVDASKKVKLGSYQYETKKLLTAPNMTVENTFALNDGFSKASISAKFQLRIYKPKPKTQDGRPSTVVFTTYSVPEEKLKVD